METAYDFLIKKGITKVHQPSRKYNLSIAELVEFLDEYATGSVREYVLKRFENKRITHQVKKQNPVDFPSRLNAI